MVRLLSIVITVCCLVPAILAAQSPVLVTNDEFRPVAQQALDSLYNRNSEAAWDIIKPWTNKYPDHPVWALWRGMELWWKVLEDLENESYDEEFFDKMKEADFKAGRFLRNNSGHPDGLIVRAAANGYMARHKANREEWVSSLNHGRIAYQSQQAMKKVLPDFADNLLAEGIIKYYAAYLPDAYPFMRTMSWFFPSGDKEEGLKLMVRAANESLFAGPESRYFLGMIRLNYEQDYTNAVQDFQKLVQKFPNNSFYRRLFVRSLYNMEKYELAAIEINKAIEHWDKQNLPYFETMKEELLYWKGRIQYRNHDRVNAFHAFTESFDIGETLPNPDKRTYRMLSAYFAGLTAEKLNNRAGAVHYYEAAASMNGNSEIKKRAKDQLGLLD
ncbi:MAG: hypothetical protein ACFCU6_06625 [Balneolaceae bacterium]